ncbi:MAG: ATP-binding cassette domain-containing protein [Bacteroidales bacterium]|nr:ATP-binding cassette domain-containing protein [Bacteroidales bacterium]
MREPVLLALVHIFAILSNVNPGGITPRGRRILRGYLRRYLNPELEEEYFKLFENNLTFYADELSSLGEEGLAEESSLINFQITNICRQIRKGLFLEERMIVFLQLLEFIYEDSEMTPHERHIIDIVARTFSIPSKEYDNAMAFMVGNHFDDVTPDCLMLIEGCDHDESRSEQYTRSATWHNLFVEGLTGSLFMLHIESINAIIFTYHGTHSLYFKGRTVVRGRPYLLETGVSIKGKDMEPVYFSGILRQFFRNKYNERLSFEGHDISFTFGGSDQGLKPMSFRADSGNMIGIMGGSGVGKSTLLNILNGKLPPETGHVFLNGYDIYGEQENLKGIIGYIPQDDLLIEELTVFQNLYYSARLCFGDCPDESIIERVDNILHDLELYEIRDLQVGNPLNKKISGGQRKRLNIGLELIREPAVLFVDEPTSGLSSHDSWKIIELLKRQTRQGKLVFSIIHQPSSDILKLFDRLWILDKGGRMAYDGDPVDSIVYFKTETSQVNAAESECPSCGNVEAEDILHLIETKEVTDEGYEGVERQVEPADWYRRYMRTMMPRFTRRPGRLPLPQNQFQVPGRLSQFNTFIRRNILRKIADRQYLVINLIESPLLAFILAFITKQTNDGFYIFADNKNLPVFIFMSVVVALFLGLTVSAEEIFRDRNILERQKYLEISMASYLGSKIMFLFWLSAFQTFTFVIISNHILGIEGMFWSFWLILFSVACFGNILGLNISAGMKSVVSIYILIPLILVPQLILGGAMIRYDDLHPSLTRRINVPVIGDLMTSRWAYEAMTVEMYKRNSYEKLFFDNDMIISQNNWYASFMIPLLQRKSHENLYSGGKEEYRDHYLNNRYKLLRYTRELSEKAGFEQSDIDSFINTVPYDSTANARVTGYLDSLKVYFRSIANKAIASRDSLVNNYRGSSPEITLATMKQNHHNQFLADILLNNNIPDKIYENEALIIQKADPVLMEPLSDIGRAHMFAPYKKIGSIRIDTLLFNIFIIWLMSVILWFTLYINLLQKVMDVFDRIRMPRLSEQLRQ